MDEKIDLSKLSKLDRAQYKKVFLKLGWKFRDIEDLIAILGELSAGFAKNLSKTRSSCHQIQKHHLGTKGLRAPSFRAS